MTTSVWQTVLLITTVNLLSCMSPGPDFAIIARNALSYERRKALFTVLGAATGILIHSTYCALGIAALLMHFPKFFVWIRCAGGVYLLYLGFKGIFSSQGMIRTHAAHQDVSSFLAFRQGFFVNILNVKAIFFIFTLFVMIQKLHSVWWSLFFIFEFSLLCVLWFSFVVYCMTHPKIKRYLTKAQKGVGRGLGIFLILLGLKMLLGE